MAHDVKHDYHLVDPSPWPLVGSISALITALGAITWMRTGEALADGQSTGFLRLFQEDGFLGMQGWGLFAIGFIGLLYTFLAWFRDVTVEAEHGGHHTPVVQLGYRYGMVLFIASEVMFFVAWFWAYFNTAMFPGTDMTTAGDVAMGQLARSEFIGAVWPPEGIQTFDPWHLPFVNTVILVTSGLTLTWAHHALVADKRREVKLGLWVTILLGFSFTCLQAYEYAHAGFDFSYHIYGATFFMATGFHGFHVIVGTIFLCVCLFRVYKGHFKPDHHFGFEAAAWYWHFVDVVWLFLFASIYVWGAGAPAVH